MSSFHRASSYLREMETLVLYRMRPHKERRLSEAAKGADSIEPFEGSRPWKGSYADSMGVALWRRLPEEEDGVDRSKAG